MPAGWRVRKSSGFVRIRQEIAGNVKGNVGMHQEMSGFVRKCQDASGNVKIRHAMLNIFCFIIEYV
jgi:hypothetical protein